MRLTWLTTPRAELNATIGAALLAARGDDPDAPTGISWAAAGLNDIATGLAPALDDDATGLAPGMGDDDTAQAGIEDPAAVGALAWSMDDDAISEPLPYQPDADFPGAGGSDNPYRPDGPRPRIDYDVDSGPIVLPRRRFRFPQLAIGAAALIGTFAFGSLIYGLANDAKPIESAPSVTEPVTTKAKLPPPHDAGDDRAPGAGRATRGVPTAAGRPQEGSRIRSISMCRSRRWRRVERLPARPVASWMRRSNSTNSPRSAARASEL